MTPWDATKSSLLRTFFSLIFLSGIIFAFPSLSFSAEESSAQTETKKTLPAPVNVRPSESVTPFPPDLEKMFDLFQKYRKYCGDGKKDDAEECDLTDPDNTVSCNRNCRIYDAALCGNGVKNSGEQCDPYEGSVAVSGCSKDCTFALLVNGPKTCNNGVLEEGEACDSPGQNVLKDGVSFACNSSCELQSVENCGNGSLDSGEECDGGSGCSNFCAQIPVCGDGVQSAGEECDDSNQSDGDGCSSLCRHEIICGDGLIEGAELCDDGNFSDGDGCSSVCRTEPVCGNGDIQIGEDCDDGNITSGDGCSSLCRHEIYCGDGIKEGSEECDDGNRTNSDGCSSTCQRESTCKIDADCAPGMTCNSATATCLGSPTCGNGIIDTGEDCEDGNTVDCDGCTHCKTTLNTSGCIETTSCEGEEYLNTGKCIEGAPYVYDAASSLCTCAGGGCEMTSC